MACTATTSFTSPKPTCCQLFSPTTMSDSESETTAEQQPKKKFKSKTIREDPHRFHAKPRELDQDLNALERPKDLDQAQPSNIFSKLPFSSFTLNERLVSTIEKPEVEGGMGMKTCTNIQSVVYPSLLEKRQNMLLKSQTGSGKTMAYLVPIIHDLMSITPKIERSDGCRTLIMAPTRELCTQIAEVLDKLTKCCVWIVGGCITGGERKKSEKGRLRKGIVVLVGTPGRLLDHLSSTESFLLTKLRWVVLDEVDRLLDMGFEQTVLQIMSIIRGEKIAGLKPKNDTTSAKNSNNAKGRALNLQQRWEQQSQAQTKKCVAADDLVFLMCSATLNRAVKSLALPLLGNNSGGTGKGANKGFLVVDADASTVDTIRCEQDILNLGKDSGRLDGNSATAAASTADVGYVAAGDDSDAESGTDKADAANTRNGAMLDKNSVIEAPLQLAQYFMMVTCKWRLAALLSFLRTHSDQKVVVFLSTCDAVDYLSLLLREMEWPTELDGGDFYKGSNADDAKVAGGSLGGRSIDEEEALATASLSATASQHLEPLECTFTGVLGVSRKFYRLHGNVPQQVRKSVYSSFCAAEKGILLCTDVAARGLDLPNVDWILQYDPPCETADYVHRIGRTARKGRAGCALLFLLPSEAAYIPLLASHGLQPEALSLQSLFVDAGKHIPGSAKFKNVDEMTAVILQRRVERVVHDNKYLLFAGRQAFRSYVRAYATHSTDTKGIFSVQSLHLGHVAKSFGLRESPKALRSSEDVIAKIFNGAYSVHNTRSVRQQSGDKRGRDGGSSGGRDRDGAKDKKEGPHKRSTVVMKDGKRKSSDDHSSSNSSGNKRQRTNEAPPSPDGPRSTQNPGVAVKSGRDKQKVRKMSSGGSGGGSKGGKADGKRSSSSGKGSQLTASGVFRKTSGYFKKKLRSQMTSEFSSS